MIGIQDVSFTLPLPVPPGSHIIQIKVSAESLSSQNEVRFVYATKGPDLSIREPYLYKLTGTNGVIYTYVTNKGGEIAPASTLQVYDGAPDAGGTLITEATVPSLSAGETREFNIDWDVSGKAGNHTIYVL